ncbi:MAG: hypothetical protein KKD44_03805 [Proteobacteria bacterium]|nr:hypothetical protein [Pseudomonadota bacterium]
MKIRFFVVCLIFFSNSFLAYSETELEINSHVLGGISLGYENRNFKISSALEEEGIVIEPSGFSVIYSRVNVFPDSFDLNLGYRTSIDNKKNESGSFNNDNKSFQVIDINLRPLALFHVFNVEFGYYKYLHYTFFEVKDTAYASGGEYYLFNNNELHVQNLAIGDRGLFTIDISKYYLNYYFGRANKPIPLYVGIEYANTIRPMTTNGDYNGLSHREIRFDEEFSETTLKLGWKSNDISAAANGFFLKEINVFYSDVVTSDKYTDLSLTHAEIEYSYGAYIEPAYKFKYNFFDLKNDSEIVVSAFLSEQDTISTAEHSDEMIFWYGVHFSFYHCF